MDDENLLRNGSVETSARRRLLADSSFRFGRLVASGSLESRSGDAATKRSSSSGLWPAWLPKLSPNTVGVAAKPSSVGKSGTP